MDYFCFIQKHRENPLSKNIAEQTGKKVRFISAETKKRSIWNEIIENSSFRGDILITTKVPDNGINITDKRVRHIVIPFCAKSDFIQMLGRKRIINTESVNVYAEIPSEAKLRSYIKETSHKTEVLHNILSHTDNYGIIRRNLQSVIAAVNGYGGAMMRATAVYPFAPAVERTTTSPAKAAAV